MARTQRTPFVILGLLGLSGREARSGYEIKKVIDTVISHFWSESNGQIYPVLGQLASDGLIREQEKEKKGRKKTSYAITPKGERALRSWLKIPPELGKPRDELILKLVFGKEMEIPALIGHLEAHRDHAKATLAQCLLWQKELEKQRNYSAFHSITLRAGILRSEVGLQWAEESIATFDRMRNGNTKGS